MASKNAAVDEVLRQLHTSLRDRIQAEADPIGFLTKVVQGAEINGEVPSLSLRTEIALKLTGKILPDMRAIDVTGMEGAKADVGVGEAFERLVSKLGRGVTAGRADQTTH